MSVTATAGRWGRWMVTLRHSGAAAGKKFYVIAAIAASHAGFVVTPTAFNAPNREAENVVLVPTIAEARGVVPEGMKTIRQVTPIALTADKSRDLEALAGRAEGIDGPTARSRGHQGMLDELGALLPQAAARFGDRTALVIEGRGFSFRELDALSTRLANRLVGLGVRPGDRVSFYAGNSWRWVVGYYGALKAGAVINPLNTMLTSEEVAFAVRDCQARVILAAADKAKALLDIRRDTPLEHVILLGDTRQAGALALDDLLLGNEAARPTVSVDPAGTSTIGYTSGTTGHPKGAMQTQRAVLLNAARYANMIAHTPADTVLTGVPLPHVYGTIVLNGCLMTGAKLVQMVRLDADAALDLAAEHRATVIEGVPTMYMYMLNSPKLAATDLSSLRLCMVGGQTTPVAKMEEVEARFGCPLKELWGMTEIAGAGTAHPVLAPKRLGSIGIPLPFTESVGWPTWRTPAGRCRTAS